MVAPAGVSEEVPQEPANSGPAQVEFAGNELTRGQDEELEEAVPAPAGPPAAELAEPDDAAEPEPAEVARAEPAEAGQAEAGEAKPAQAELAEAELAVVGEPGSDVTVESRDVSPLAVVGIIVAILALVGVAAGVLAMVTHGFRPKTVITYRPAAVFGLLPGQCIDSGADILAVTVLSCATPHDAEVFATFSLPAGAWPGGSAVQQEAGNGCQGRFASYLNPQLTTADLTQEYVYPNQAAWQAGERTVVCEVRAADGKLTGSVHATG